MAKIFPDEEPDLSLCGELRAIFDSVLECRHELCKDDAENMMHLQALLEDWTRTYSQTICTNDFSPSQQWGYMYMYMLRHVHLVYHALTIMPLPSGLTTALLCNTNQTEYPNVCMVGGGPGCDVIGLALFILLKGIGKASCGQFIEKVTVLDKCKKWSTSWNALLVKLPVRYRQGIPDATYEHFDYKEGLSDENAQIVANADVITMIKSLSAVCTFTSNEPTMTLNSILDHMKDGAFLLYVDNCGGPQKEILMNAVENNGSTFEVNCFDDELTGVAVPHGAFSNEATKFIQKIDFKPCKTAGTNEVILFKKNIK